jgi:hypothetical protein
MNIGASWRGGASAALYRERGLRGLYPAFLTYEIVSSNQHQVHQPDFSPT